MLLSAELFQSCLTLCDSMDFSLSGSSVHGIHQARILEWISMPSSRGSSQPKDPICVSGVSCIEGSSLPPAPPGRPINTGFHGASTIKSLPAMQVPQETWVLIPVSGRFPGRGHGNPFQYSCLDGEFHVQRNLVVYSPWSSKESDTTEVT